RRKRGGPLQHLRAALVDGRLRRARLALAGAPRAAPRPAPCTPCARRCHPVAQRRQPRSERMAARRKRDRRTSRERGSDLQENDVPVPLETADVDGDFNGAPELAGVEASQQWEASDVLDAMEGLESGDDD